MRPMVLTALGAIAFCAAAWVAPASAAIVVDFSMPASGPDGLGGTASGTLAGEIFGLTNNATGAATDLVITSYPSGLTGLPSTPWDIFTDAAFFAYANSFTLTGGTVTAANFGELDLVMGLSIGTGSAQLVDVGTSGEVFGSGMTFEVTGLSAPASTPEPASLALLLSGVLGLRAMRRRA